jgi:hypothetical protein
VVTEEFASRADLSDEAIRFERPPEHAWAYPAEGDRELWHSLGVA